MTSVNGLVMTINDAARVAEDRAEWREILRPFMWRTALDDDDDDDDDEVTANF